MAGFPKAIIATRSQVGAVFAVLLCLVGAPVNDAWAKEPITRFGLTFPAEAADAKIGTAHDFEKNKPGLGHSVEYLQPGWKINVYIYDLGEQSIPDDPESKIVKRQLKQAANDIFDAGRRGVYDNVELKHEYTIADTQKRTRFLCSAFLYLHKTAGDVDSFLCVTSWSGKFIKIRMTTRRAGGAQATARKFIDAWAKVLWPGS